MAWACTTVYDRKSGVFAVCACWLPSVYPYDQKYVTAVHVRGGLLYVFLSDYVIQ